jgi:NADH:ubiquinone oxidoreductase subunit 5 (subunit L)/multisubunit Na+/H+ antiporter MnhA subunit
MGIPVAAFFFGTLSAYHLYRGRATDPLHITVLARKFYIDEFYDNRLVRLQQLTAGCLNWIDRWILDGVIIRGGAYLSVGMGELFRLFQTGSLQAYAFIFTLGGVALIYFTLFTH